MVPRLERRLFRIRGTVQGVGFRPFVHRLATALQITGSIGNDDAGVWCEAQASAAVLDQFAATLVSEAPPLATVGNIDIERIRSIEGETDFLILATGNSTGSLAMSIPPDVAACEQCLIEIADPSNRRFGYPFTCCTNCGPRYSVVRSLPYDRERTSMADFPLCSDCATEYAASDDRRHHAQATCCPTCGPTLQLVAADGTTIPGDAAGQAAAILSSGAIVAVKGVGGFQLMCRSDDEAVVTRLRERKHRDDKPFALLVASVERARAIADLDEISLRALEGPEAPIVLAPRRASADLVPAVAPGNRLVGVMLPASPLHAMLSGAVPFNLVCTSGNRSDEPIATDDADAFERLGPIADAFLIHDRRIERRADDSVGQSVAGRFQVLRRARGFAPRPIRLASSGPPVLGVGAELKSTVCLAIGRDAHMSAHLGDLEHVLAIAAFEEAIADHLSLARVTPELVVSDLHPEYISTKFAAAQDFGPTLAVQHHHAHLASCLAEHHHVGPAIGVTFDGLGWGTDGTAWGGEFLVGDASGYRRAAHLAQVGMPGGSASIREPWRMAVAHLVAAFGRDLPPVAIVDRHAAEVAAVVSLCDTSIATSSTGRLFDAVAALCGLADAVTFEGQAAIGLEQIATATSDRYEWDIADAGGVFIIDAAPIVRGVVADQRRGVDVGRISGAFHGSVAQMIACVCGRLGEETGIATVALSGGVFQNRRLVELVVPLLDRGGFTTLCQSQVPSNDGGISLGQVSIGRAHLERVD